MKRLVLLLIFCNAFFCFGETIRGNLSGILRLDDQQEGQQLALYLDQLAGLELDLENPFLEGVEIQLQIPQGLQNYRNSFAVYLYKDLAPLPDLQVSRYQGNQVMMHILPTQNQLSLKIPLRSDHSIIRDASSVVSSPLGMEAFPMMIALVPIMKGIPDGAYSWPVSMEIRPIFQNMGGLQLQLEGDAELINNGLILRLNGQEISYDPEQVISLAPGIHSLVIQSEQLGTKEYTIPIEVGVIHYFEEEFSAQPARVVFQEYPGVIYRINGEELEQSQQELAPGTYALEIEINPQWIIEEEIQILAGEEMNFELDIQLVPLP